ncbi:MAG: TIGR04086 family membrane protein [Eubacterium sp.]|nr:TIGR04086 family membrane protein [Eubacterium sp.]
MINSTNKLLAKFALKAIISTIISILVFTFLFSQITYRLDLNLDINKVFSIFIVFFCSAIIAFVSVKSMKNNGALMGIVSQIPLIFYSVINLIFNDNSFIFFLIKLAIIILTGALFGILAVKKSNKFKV